MTQQNPYDHLRISGPENIAPVEATACWTVTESRSETISITTALLPDGGWVYGYIVYWAKGGTSTKLPSAERGKFRTQREAKLHAIGFMKTYLPYFTQDTRDDLRSAEASLLQANLFE